MRFFWLCFFSLMMCVQGFCSEKKGKLHVLILFDAAQTQLQNSYKQDSVVMQKTFKNVSRFIKYPLRLKCVSTQKFSLHDMRSWLRKVRSSRDIVVVYTSGPESSNPEYTGLWPSISLSVKNELVPADQLSQMVQAKHPRLSIVLVDCYNSEFDLAGNHYIDLGKSIKRKDRRHFLFDHWRKTKGYLLACSHAKGQAGYGLKKGSQQQGLFTRAFLQTIVKCSIGLYANSLQKGIPHPALPIQKFVCQDSLKSSIRPTAIKGGADRLRAPLDH